MFTVALPPYLATAALHALDMLKNSQCLVERLRENCSLIQDTFGQIYGMELLGDRFSPIKHLRVNNELSSGQFSNDRNKLKTAVRKIVDKVIKTNSGKVYNMMSLKKIKYH